MWDVGGGATRSRGLSPRSYLGDSEREVVNAAPGVLGIMTLDDG